MAVRLAGNNTSYLEHLWAPIVSEPLSLVGFFQYVATGAYVCGFCIMNSTTNTNGYQILFPNNVNANPACANKPTNAGDNRATVASVMSANDYRHLSAIFPTNASHSILGQPGNFGASFSGTVNLNATPDRILVGNRYAGTSHDAPYTGLVAEVAVILGTVTPAQSMALGSGLTPEAVFPRSQILFYAPLKDNLIDKVSGRAMRYAGDSLTFGPHPLTRSGDYGYQGITNIISRGGSLPSGGRPTRFAGGWGGFAGDSGGFA